METWSVGRERRAAEARGLRACQPVRSLAVLRKSRCSHRAPSRWARSQTPGGALSPEREKVCRAGTA